MPQQNTQEQAKCQNTVATTGIGQDTVLAAMIFQDTVAMPMEISHDTLHRVKIIQLFPATVNQERR